MQGQETSRTRYQFCVIRTEMNGYALSNQSRPEMVIGVFHDPLAMAIIRLLRWTGVITGFQRDVLTYAWKLVKGAFDTVFSILGLAELFA